MNGIRWGVHRSVLVLIAFAVAACGSDSKGPEKAGPPATLSVLSGSGQEGQAGEALSDALTVKAVDLQGRPVPGAIVTFVVGAGGGTLAQAVDTTDSQGTASTRWTMGGTLGAARVDARVQGLVVPAVFTATVKAGPPAAVARVSALVGSSASGFDVVDSVAVRVTDRFQHPLPGVNVAFAVTAGGGTVSHVTKTTGADGVARTAWKLGQAGAQTLRASAGAFNVDVSGTAVSCNETSIAVGQVIAMTPGDATCLVTTGTGTQKYIVAVTNSSTVSSSSSSFRLRGAGGGSVSTATAATRPLSARTGGVTAQHARDVLESASQVRAHSELLRANFELIERLGPARRANARASANLVQAAPLPNVGDILPVKIPSLNDLCSVANAASIGARVLYVGSRAVVLVDTAAASNIAQNDAMYRAMGEEFDNSMFQILTSNFGDPLAMDAQTDQNGRLFMVFSHHVNQAQAGTVAGFVTSGDFFPTSECAASNVGEYFYARVPTEEGVGFTSNSTSTFDEWHRMTRTVVVHEVKHIASFAEKFASPASLPAGYFARNVWLEEGSAMMAEEIWARTIFNYAQNGNTNYASSIFCEVRPTTPECQPTRPTSMIDHFFFLYQYYNNSDLTSVVGSTSTGQSTFYGSGWMFLRWVIDTYGQNEAAFLSAMNRDMVAPGTDNIEARTGKSFAELLSEFAIAIALDDLPGFTPAEAKYSLPSWNTRDVFSALSADFSSQGFFASPAPLKVRTNSFGRFAVDVPAVHGGGFAIFELSGSTTSKQLLEFKGPSGAGFPAEMRVRIARVQ